MFREGVSPLLFANMSVDLGLQRTSMDKTAQIVKEIQHGKNYYLAVRGSSGLFCGHFRKSWCYLRVSLVNILSCEG